MKDRTADSEAVRVTRYDEKSKVKETRPFSSYPGPVRSLRHPSRRYASRLPPEDPSGPNRKGRTRRERRECDEMEDDGTA